MKKAILAICFILLMTLAAGSAQAVEDFGLVLKGPHPGEITQGSKTYPFTIQVDYHFHDTGEITGSIQWTTLGSIHAIEGTLIGRDLYFKEIDYIRKGKAKLNCVYRMKYSPSVHLFQGAWQELGTNKGGTAVIKLR